MYTQERILRYPDGKERVLRYSVEATVDEEADDEHFLAWDVVGLPGDSSRADLSRQKVSGAMQPVTPAPSFQDTAAYLESLFSASYEMQPTVDVDHCYQVLHGCPWVLPKAVYVLALQGRSGDCEGDIRSTYTLRTKVNQEGASYALAKLLNKQHLADALEVSKMLDGVIMFESDHDADRYARMLEEEGHNQVMVAEVDSHKAFRMASDVKAVVVLLPHGAQIPPPYQLAASLKQKKSWDSM
eukprot:gene10296-10455_t